jgi:hypothetical protein
MWARIWGLCPSRKIPETASRNWASARPEMVEVPTPGVEADAPPPPPPNVATAVFDDENLTLEVMTLVLPSL